MNLLPGATRVTALTAAVATAIGVSGKPTRVFSVHLVSLTAADIGFRNGTSDSGTKYLTINGTANKGITVNFEGGVLFPSGCYLTSDLNLDYATIVATTEPY